jgi:hypothetical protein
MQFRQTRRSRKLESSCTRSGQPSRQSLQKHGPALGAGVEARQDRAGPRARRWLPWPNTKQGDQNCPFRGAIQETQNCPQVLAPDRPACTGCLDCSGCGLAGTGFIYRKRSRSEPRFRRVSIDNVAVSVTHQATSESRLREALRCSTTRPLSSTSPGLTGRATVTTTR